MTEPAVLPLWVAVVDDDLFACEWLAQQISQLGYQTRSFTCGALFLQQLDPYCGVALVDLQMPEPCGLSLQQQINQRQLPLPLVFVSGSNNLPDVVCAMREGAVDFLAKPVEMAPLAQALRRAWKLAQQWRHEQAHEQQLRSRMERLTPRERDILQLLLDGLTNRELAERLHISSKTAEEHRANLLRKMEVRNSTQLAALLAASRHPG